MEDNIRGTGDCGYGICQRCVMDTSNPEIVFDKDGVCNFCHDYEAATTASLLTSEEASAKLRKVLAMIRKAGRRNSYDCILGLSGGVDSSYLAVKLNEFGLRTLAVQFDNGWNTPLASNNIEVLCRKLNMDLYTYKVDEEEFRDLQLAFLKASVANVEAPSDHGIVAALMEVAAERGIKYIIDGINTATEQISVRAYGWRFDDLRQLRAIHRKYGTVKLRSYPQMGILKKIYYKKIRGIKKICLLNYMSYNQNAAISQLESQYDWQYYGGKHFESIITRFHQAYILINKFKFDKRRAHLSNLIYSNQLTRSEALEILNAPPCPSKMIEEDHEYFLRKLKLSRNEFSEIMMAPIRSYRDYRNSEYFFRVYERFARLFALMRKKLGRPSSAFLS